MAQSYSRKRERNGAGRKYPAPLSRLTVRPRPGNPSQGLVNVAGRVFVCALGRGGVTALKREGDGATPLGLHRSLAGYFRRDRLPDRRSGLQLSPIDRELGWCDAPHDRNYNRPVRRPYAAGHEAMWRHDRLYDVCIVLDWNIRPRKRMLGSAIFLHIAGSRMEPTEGCIAVCRSEMKRLLPLIRPQTRIMVLR